MKTYFVYILASHKNGTFYVGVTSDLNKRVWQHKNDLADGFTKKYKVHTLVYFEQGESIEGAIQREKELKRWSRDRKRFLIEQSNPEWKDLYDELLK